MCFSLFASIKCSGRCHICLLVSHSASWLIGCDVVVVKELAEVVECVFACDCDVERDTTVIDLGLEVARFVAFTQYSRKRYAF